MKQPSVLIVEDEGIVAADIQQTLLEQGYDAFAIAMSADEALRRATERSPDVVLMDIRIKGVLDGIETAKLIREQFHVPIVFLTAHADAATLERAKLVEPSAYLTKPVRPDELRSAIEIALYRGGMERRLRERERWFSTTLHSIADAVLTVDLAGTITFMNAEAEILTGQTAAEAVGRPAHAVLQRVASEQARAFSSLDEALREQHKVIASESGLVHATTGAVRAISESAAPVVDGGRMLGAVMVFRDVTEHKRLQHQLELADRLAALGTMAAGVAHEINNPLTVVISATSLITDDVEEARRALVASGIGLPGVTEHLDFALQALADVTSAGERIRQITRDLSAFARPAPTSTGAASVDNALAWAIRSTASQVRHRAALTTRFVRVPLVAGDEVRLGQVFVNLIVNAAQAITEGHADLNRIELATEVLEDGRVVVEVRDTGCGIPLELRNKVFDPFFTTKPVGVGTGLGLSISRGIIHSMGGELSIEGNGDLGTTVRVVLLPASEHPIPPPGSSSGTALERPRGRILAIDDEPVVLRALERVLRDHDVTGCGDARDALALIEKDATRFDVIFVSLRLAPMTGIDFFERVLARAPDVARRIVFVTGGTLLPHEQDFLAATSNPSVEKPFTRHLVVALVNQLVGPVARVPSA